jgi:release factor glutamine methyltransferase
MVARRRAGEPLQHVVGHWGFRQLDLVVSRAALVPRPETEIVVEVALTELARLEGRRAVDLGTGTGAIAISIAVEAPRCEVFATDRSAEALRLASANLAGVGRLAAGRVTLAAGDWYGALSPALAGTIDLVVSNPPYVSEAEWAGLEPEVRLYDPRSALVAGPNGLEDVEKVVGGAGAWLAPAAAVVVEIAPHQADAACRVALRAGFAEAEVLPDLAGRPRVLVGRR